MSQRVISQTIDLTNKPINKYITEITGGGIIIHPAIESGNGTLQLDGDGIYFKKASDILASFTGLALTFYRPTTTDAAATLDSDGLNIVKGSINLNNNFIATTEGVITAKSGTVGGFSINATLLQCYGTASGVGTSDTGLYRLYLQASPGNNGGNSAWNVQTRSSTSDNWISRTGVSYKGDAWATNLTLYDSNNVKRAAVNTSGLLVYDTDGSTQVASFGSNATIGKTANMHFIVSPTELQAKSGTTPILYIKPYGSLTTGTAVHIESYTTKSLTGLYYDNNNSEESSTAALVVNSKVSSARYTDVSMEVLASQQQVNIGANHTSSNYASLSLWSGGTNQITLGTSTRKLQMSSNGIQLTGDHVILTWSKSLKFGYGDTGIYGGSYNDTRNIYYNVPKSDSYHSFYVGGSGIIYVYSDKVTIAKPSTISGKLTVSSGGAAITGAVTMSSTLTTGSTIIAGGAIYPKSASGSACGTSDYPWSQVAVGSGNFFRTAAPSAYSQTYAACWHQTDAGNYTLIRPSSSRKYKKDIEDISDSYLDPHKLYNLRVVQFRYKERDKDDPKNSKWNPTAIIPGFIAEEMAEAYPVGGVINENDEIDDWDLRTVVPPMLKLIQEQHQEIEQLKKEVAQLKNK